MQPVQAVVSVLGPIQLLHDGQEQRLAGKLTRKLLARLVLADGQALSSSELIETMWGQPATPEALRVQISRLRRLLQPSGLEIVTSSQGWALDRGSFIDSRSEVRKRLANLENETDPARAVKQCTKILTLWTGPTLAEFSDEPWGEFEATRFDRIRENVRQHRSEALAISGAIPEALSELSAANREFPFDETCASWFAACLAASGRSTDALEVLASLRERLAEELGLFYGDLPNRVEQAILTNAPNIVRLLPTQLNFKLAAVGTPLPTIEQPAFDHELIGRKREWELLVSSRPTARPRVTVVCGETGSGKSSLVSAYGRFRAQNVSTIVTGSFREESNVPYEMFVSALKSSPNVENASADFPGVHQLLSRPKASEEHTDARPEEIGESFGALIQSLGKRQQVLVVIEDLQWANQSSQRSLLSVLSVLRSDDLPIELLLTYSTAPGTTTVLSEPFRGILASSEHEIVMLPSFGPIEITEYLRGLGRSASTKLANAVGFLTAGNPFLVKELLDHFNDSEVISAIETGSNFGPSTMVLPPMIARAVEQAVGRLSPTVQRVCAVVALHHSPVSFLTLSSVFSSENHDDLYRSIDEGIAANLLVEDPTSGDFSLKNLLYEFGILSQLSQRDRFVLNRQIADALIEQTEGAAFVPPGQISKHLERSGNLVKPRLRSIWLIKTAEHARLQGASDLATQASDLALELTEQSGNDTDWFLAALRIRQLVAASVGDSARSKSIGTKLVSAALRVDRCEIAADALASHCSHRPTSVRS